MKRLPVACISLTLLIAFPAYADKARKPVPAKPAAQYPLHATHDGVTIAAEPGDMKETRADTRLDYFHHGFMPIRVIVTNDTEQPLLLDEARILFLAADGSTNKAATDDDLQRRLFSQKQVQPTRIPIGPIPVTIHKKEVDKQILADDDDFGFPTTTVAPHTTVSGVLYYDTREIDDPVLEHATLQIRRVHFSAVPPAASPDLEEFTIALQPADDAQPTKLTKPVVTDGDDSTPKKN